MKLKEFIKLVDTKKFCPITVMDKDMIVDCGDLVNKGGHIDKEILANHGNDEVDPEMDPKNLGKSIYDTYLIALVDKDNKMKQNMQDALKDLDNEKPMRIIGMTKKEIKAICKKLGLKEKEDSNDSFGIHNTSQITLTNRKCRIRRIDKKQYLKDCKWALQSIRNWIEVKEKGYGPKELARLVCQDVLDRMHPSFMNVRYQECEQAKIEKEITISSKIIEEAIEIIKEEI
jgi:hypothetical protein